MLLRLLLLAFAVLFVGLLLDELLLLCLISTASTRCDDDTFLFLIASHTILISLILLLVLLLLVLASTLHILSHRLHIISWASGCFSACVPIFLRVIVVPAILALGLCLIFVALVVAVVRMI